MPSNNIMTLFVACALCLGAAVSAEAETQAAGQFPALDAAIVARMRKHGLPGLSLALVAQVRRYIPWFAVGDEAASDAITTRHLILHASGLSDAGFPLVLPDEAPLENAVRSLRAARPTAPVGARHRYFYLGYTVLAYLIELVSGQSYADYLRDHIFTPLSMLDTTASPEEAVGLAQGYSRLFGFDIPMRQKAPAYAVGAGYIVSTLEDMARYASAMLSGAEGLVSADTARVIFTPGSGAYGFGWHIYDGGATVLHGGANETFRTDLRLYPREGRAFVMLVNQGHQIDHFISAVQAAPRGGHESREARAGRSPLVLDPDGHRGLRHRTSQGLLRLAL